MFYIKLGYPREDDPVIGEVTAANMFASCCVCGREVHLSPDDVIHNVNRLVKGDFLCRHCVSDMIGQLCGDDDEEEFDDEYEDDDEEYEEGTCCDDADEERDEDEQNDYEGSEPDAQQDEQLSRLRMEAARHDEITELTERVFRSAKKPSVLDVMLYREAMEAEGELS